MSHKSFDEWDSEIRTRLSPRIANQAFYDALCEDLPGIFDRYKKMRLEIGTLRQYACSHASGPHDRSCDLVKGLERQRDSYMRKLLRVVAGENIKEELMGCITRECRSCGHIDGKYPPNSSERTTCPKCGGSMRVEFDEFMDHDDREHEEVADG